MIEIKTQNLYIFNFGYGIWCVKINVLPSRIVNNVKLKTNDNLTYIILKTVVILVVAIILCSA